MADAQATPAPKRILVLGATGTIGRAVTATLVRRGYNTVCFIRQNPPGGGDNAGGSAPLHGADIRYGDVTDPKSIIGDALRDETFDVLISCLASRDGNPADAWKVDYRAHVDILSAAQSAGVPQFILLSALCVQKPQLEFQRAKLAFEKALVDSGLIYSIIRPTAFFKSLSGQVERIKKGKPFLVFGTGELTACKPISDADLAEYMADCIERHDRHNRILPIGGPGNAITPKQQGDMLFTLLGKTPRFRHVPVKFLDAVILGLTMCGWLFPAAARKAGFARIGRYYATESMLVIDPQTGAYNADATPSTGTDTLHQHYQRMIGENLAADLGQHAVF